MNPQRGQIYRLKHDEMNKRRPVVILSRNFINGGNAVVVIPFYSQQIEKRGSLDYCALFYAGEGGLEKDCVAKADEISKIDKLAINLAAGPAGSFNKSQMARIGAAVKWALHLD